MSLFILSGFSHLIDLTYPLTSQTILTDGQMFSFLAYQLNTLELWKDDEASPMVNLCWHSKEIPLYHSVENGKVLYDTELVNVKLKSDSRLNTQSVEKPSIFDLN